MLFRSFPRSRVGIHTLGTTFSARPTWRIFRVQNHHLRHYCSRIPKCSLAASDSYVGPTRLADTYFHKVGTKQKYNKRHRDRGLLSWVSALVGKIVSPVLYILWVEKGRPLGHYFGGFTCPSCNYLGASYLPVRYTGLCVNVKRRCGQRES